MFATGQSAGPLGTGAPAPAYPGAPMAPSTTPGGVVNNSVIPGVDSYAGAALAAKNAYQRALAQINEQRTGALRQYGYLGDIDPTTGTLKNMRVDPNNPYGLFQEMLSQHATAQDQARAAAAARGLGHGGLAAQGITADHKAFGADSAQLGESLMAQLEGLQGQQNDAATSMNDALYQAQQQAAENAIANGNFSTPDFSGLTIPQYGTPMLPAPKATPKPPAKSAPKPAQKKLPNAYTTGQKKRG